MARIRTNVYIDAANLNKGIRNIGCTIDYEKFYLWLKKKYKIQDVFIFFGYIHKLESEYRYLEHLGYKLIFKETLKEEKILKANCDAELILNSLINYFGEKFDKMILVSGDGDYTCLVKFLIKKNKLTTIIAPNYIECSIFLKRIFENVVFIENPNLRKLVCTEPPTNEKAPE